MSESEQLTSTKYGRRAGEWTREQLQECGWSSAQACLEHIEELYLEYMADVARMSDPEVAARHREYYAAWIESGRTSLRALMQE